MDYDVYIDAKKIELKKDKEIISLVYNTGDGTVAVKPKRLFPISKPFSHISFIDKGDNEIGVLKSFKELPKEIRDHVKKVLDHFYFIPHILEIVELTEEYGMGHWSVITDKGQREFDVRNRNTDIKVIQGNRILIKDADDNTYEIPDYDKLSPKSKSLIDGEI